MYPNLCKADNLQLHHWCSACGPAKENWLKKGKTSWFGSAQCSVKCTTLSDEILQSNSVKISLGM
jgi:hypothetical protein